MISDADYLIIFIVFCWSFFSNVLHFLKTLISLDYGNSSFSLFIDPLTDIQL